MNRLNGGCVECGGVCGGNPEFCSHCNLMGGTRPLTTWQKCIKKHHGAKNAKLFYSKTNKKCYNEKVKSKPKTMKKPLTEWQKCVKTHHGAKNAKLFYSKANKKCNFDMTDDFTIPTKSMFSTDNDETFASYLDTTLRDRENPPTYEEANDILFPNGRTDVPQRTLIIPQVRNPDVLPIPFNIYNKDGQQQFPYTESYNADYKKINEEKLRRAEDYDNILFDIKPDINIKKKNNKKKDRIPVPDFMKDAKDNAQLFNEYLETPDNNHDPEYRYDHIIREMFPSDEYDITINNGQYYRGVQNLIDLINKGELSREYYEDQISFIKKQVRKDLQLVPFIPPDMTDRNVINHQVEVINNLNDEIVRLYQSYLDNYDIFTKQQRKRAEKAVKLRINTALRISNPELPIAYNDVKKQLNKLSKLYHPDTCKISIDICNAYIQLYNNIRKIFNESDKIKGAGRNLI